MEIKYATKYNVGEWDGNEDIAAANFNRILDAIANAMRDDQEKFDFASHYAWDDWGSDENLLSIDDDEIQRYVDEKWAD